MVGRIAILAGLALALAACEGAKQQLGLTKQPPDEFRVQARAPLSLPPDFSLRPPAPGATRPQEGDTQAQARRALVGAGQSGEGSNGFSFSGAAPVETRSAGELALLRQAGAGQGDPDIRQIIDRETDVYNAENRDFLETLVFWRDEEPPGEIVDAEAEARRLRENAALGKSPVEGRTPTIERRKKALFEGIF